MVCSGLICIDGSSTYLKNIKFVFISKCIGIITADIPVVILQYAQLKCYMYTQYNLAFKFEVLVHVYLNTDYKTLNELL